MDAVESGSLGYAHHPRTNMYVYIARPKYQGFKHLCPSAFKTKSSLGGVIESDLLCFVLFNSNLPSILLSLTLDVMILLSDLCW